MAALLAVGVVATAVTMDAGRAAGSVAAAPVHREQWEALACGTPSQCTAITASGYEVTFDPVSLRTLAAGSVSIPGTHNVAHAVSSWDSLGDPAGVPIALVSGLTAMSCPSASQCTAVGTSKNAVTFNPMAPATAHVMKIDAFGVVPTITCPTVAQCTAVDNIGYEFTFDPGSGQMLSAHNVQAPMPGTVTCPSVSQCIVADAGGYEVTFDPGAPRRARVSPRSVGKAVDLTAVACPTATRCLAVDQTFGAAFAFDPHARGGALHSESTRLQAPDAKQNISAPACVSATRCIVLLSNSTEVRITLGSRLHAVRGMLPGTRGVFAPACPTPSRCVAVGDAGELIGFNPNTPEEVSQRHVVLPALSTAR